MNLQNDILHVVKYYRQFEYPPSEEEIYLFLHSKASKKRVQTELKKMIEKKLLLKRVIASSQTTKQSQLNKIAAPSARNDIKLVENWILNIEDSPRYTLPGYSIVYRKYTDRTVNAGKKLQKLLKLTSVINNIPNILFVGVSGSLSMFNTQKEDDIDLCIITAKNRLWTARFYTSLIMNILGVRRKRNDSYPMDKVCLNLFFDTANLSIPMRKRTEYVGHEVLQMKPILNRDSTYEKFLKTNKWVFNLFPNAPLVTPSPRRGFEGALANARNISGTSPEISRQARDDNNNKLGDIVEKVLKHLQLFLINRHRTTEIITDTQLWFFPDDFEKKLTH